MKVRLHVPRPQMVDLALQGRRGPFAPLLMVLETSASLNVWMMRQKRYPLIYDAGIRYTAEDLPRNHESGYDEDFLNIEELIKSGKGDCDDIAPARVAEYRFHRGVAAKPCIKWKFVANPQSPGDLILLIHVLVQLPDGSLEDPCRILGMKGEYE